MGRAHPMTWEMPGYNTCTLLFLPKSLMTLQFACKPPMMSLPAPQPKYYTTVVTHAQSGFLGGLDAEEEGLSLLVCKLHAPSK